MKSHRHDSFGVPPRKKNGVLHTDRKAKDSIMLNEFKSVFTQEDKSWIPKLSGPAYPKIPKLVIHEDGVAKLLSKLDPNKATGSEKIPCFLKN